MVPLSDLRVRAVWSAFKQQGWIIGSLQHARTAVEALDADGGAAADTPGRVRVVRQAFEADRWMLDTQRRAEVAVAAFEAARH